MPSSKSHLPLDNCHIELTLGSHWVVFSLHSDGCKDKRAPGRRVLEPCGNFAVSLRGHPNHKTDPFPRIACKGAPIVQKTPPGSVSPCP